MAENSDQKPAGLSKGIGTGVKLWLYFLIGFLLVKYPIRLSIILGLLAGIGGGLINEWWKTEDPDAEEDREIAPQKRLLSTSKSRTEKLIKKRQRYSLVKEKRVKGKRKI